MEQQFTNTLSNYGQRLRLWELLHITEKFTEQQDTHLLASLAQY